MNLDADLRNADWLKVRAWDLPTDPTVFLDAIGGSDKLEAFLHLPAAEAMPMELRYALMGMSKAEWDEAAHPRDEAGRFTSTDGAGVVDHSPDTDSSKWRSVVADIREQGPGNCYEAAGTLMMNAHELGLENARIVHATVAGRGDLEGVRFGHAWVEADAGTLTTGEVTHTFRNAYDFSSGNSVVMPDSLYRHLGAAEDIHEYTEDEALGHMVSTMHYGPWEGDVHFAGTADWKGALRTS